MKMVDLSHMMNLHTPGWVGYAGNKMYYAQNLQTKAIGLDRHLSEMFRLKNRLAVIVWLIRISVEHHRSMGFENPVHEKLDRPTPHLALEIAAHLNRIVSQRVKRGGWIDAIRDVDARRKLAIRFKFAVERRLSVVAVHIVDTRQPQRGSEG